MKTNILISTLVLIGGIAAAADTVPDDVVRAVSKSKPKARSSSATRKAVVVKPSLIDESNLVEARLNRAEIRYENLARRFPDAIADWRERTRQTLLRIEAVLAKPSDDAEPAVVPGPPSVGHPLAPAIEGEPNNLAPAPAPSAADAPAPPRADTPSSDTSDSELSVAKSPQASTSKTDKKPVFRCNCRCCKARR